MAIVKIDGVSPRVVDYFTQYVHDEGKSSWCSLILKF
jgi:hypothetical protein